MHDVRAIAGTDAPPEARDPAAGLIVALLAGRSWMPEPSDRDEFRLLLRRSGLESLAVAQHRVQPFLPDDLAASLEPRYLATALHSTLTLESGRRARRILARSGIESLLFKGAALLDTGVYGDPGARRMDDADLLVRPDRADEAVRRLMGAGFEPWEPWDPTKLRWVDSVALSDSTAPAASEAVTVDLHWRVRYGSLRFGGGAGRADAVASGPDLLWQGADRERGVPAVPAHLVAIAEHVLKHLRVGMHGPGLADLVRLSDRIDRWEPVVERLARRSDARAFGILFEILRDDLGAAVPATAARIGGDGWLRRRMRARVAPTRLLRSGRPVRTRMGGLLFRWLLAGAPGAAAAEVLRSIIPDEPWLRARYGGPDRSLVDLRLRYWRDVVRWAIHRGRSPVSPNQGTLE